MAMVRYGRLAITTADLNMGPLAATNDHTTMLQEPFNHL
jgi:hypothetical protein